MCWFETFSATYANGVTALVAAGALVLASITLWFLKREYSAKYRPYVVPIVEAEKIQDSIGCVVSIIPRNVGPHPCFFKLTKVRLHVGDETYETPDMKEWMLLGTAGMAVRFPAGHVNDNGVTKIREARYKSNRIEVTFLMHTTSIEHKFNATKAVAYEINVQGDQPQTLSRPEWEKDA